MKNKFTGENGQRRLIQTIKSCQAFLGNKEAASAIADTCELIEFQDGEYLIRQDDYDDDLFILINGSVNILINSRFVAMRNAPEHVGEMCLIDPKARRSATVIARGTVLAAKVEESEFTKIAQRFPELWRNLAVEMASRLRQRGKFLVPPNEISRLFMGCSTKSLSIAQQIQYNLNHDPIEVVIWSDQIFKPTSQALEDLTRELSTFDFSIFLLTADDLVESRSQKSFGPRDNVILELGLFLGQLGKERVFLVKERNVEIKLPSDLLGLRVLDYKRSSDNLASALGPVCHEIRVLVKTRGPR